MAKLLAYYNLCPINNLKEFLGLSKDLDSGSVINTLGKNIVLIIKLSNQKQLKSWTVLEKFSSKVVYDFQSKQYIGVFANRNIRCWSEDEVDINKIKKIKFYRNIYDLFTIPNNENTLVVYDDGTCESFESALQTRKEDKLDPQRNKVAVVQKPNLYNISNVTTFEMNDRPEWLLLTYFTQDIVDSTIELHYFPIDRKSLKSQDKVKRIKIGRPEHNVKLLCYTVVQGTYFPSLLTVWSDKRVFLKSLHYDLNSPVEQHGNLITLFEFINVEQSIAILGIDTDCIAIYTGNASKDGATLILYNVQFKVIQSKQYFKVYFNDSKFWLIDNNLLLAAGQTLGVFPFRISKEQLSDMIGSQKVNQLSVNPVINEYINEEFELEDVMEFDDPQHIATDEVEFQLPRIKNKNSKLQAFENPEVIENDLRSLYKENVIIDIQRDANLPGDTLQIKLFNSNVPESLLLSDYFELIVNDLVRCGASEMELFEKLISVMIESNSTSDIGKSLQRFSTVSEKSIVKCLRYALDCPELQECDRDSRNIDLLSIVLSCSFNRSNMISHVRNELSFELVLQLLHHLYSILIHPELQLKENSTNCDEFDHDEKIIEWMNILIDAHYQQFVMTKDEKCLSLLVKWQTAVGENIELMKQLKSLEPVLQNVVRRKVPTKKTKSNKWYSIESVTLY